MDLAWLTALLLACAFAMGFLVPRGTTCAVAAVDEVLVRRTAWRFGGFAITVATVTAMVLPLAWTGSLPVQLAGTTQISLLVALGGLVFGIGAAINGACVFGTLTKLVGGDLSYLAVLPGLWLGGVAIGLSGLALAPTGTGASALGQPDMPALMLWGLVCVLLLAGLGWFARSRRLAKGLIMGGIGVSGGLLYALHPIWSYHALVQDLALAIIMAPRQMADGLLPWLVGAACLGGVVSSVLAGQFKLKAPQLRTSGGALVGGFLMAFGIVAVPGGNDGLVLSLLPALVPSAALAYVNMNLGIGLMLSLRHGYTRLGAQGGGHAAG